MTISQDKVVAMHYTVTDPQGNELDSSVGGEPLVFLFGHGSLIPGLEQALAGKTTGDKFKADIAAAEAYGEHSPENTVTLERAQIPPHIELELGASLSMHQDGGQVVEVVITDLTDSHVTLDANHPLAGRDLTFELELVSIS